MAVFVQLSVVLCVDYYQRKQNAKRLANFQLSGQESNTLVVYYSRSGNTELMAYQIATLKKGDVLLVEASDYKVSYRGWVQSMIDARKTRAVIRT